MQQQGKGIETLGTVLAVGGWALGALALFALLSILAQGVPRDAALPILFATAASVLACLALAGIGHLLRAVAQLGRNMHRLAAMVKEGR